MNIKVTHDDLMKKFNDISNKAKTIDLSNVVKRYASDHNISIDEAKSHERELMRYFIICACIPEEKFPMAGKADDFWHTFLLFTNLYRQFSELITDGDFIDHDPLEGEADEKDIDLYIKFIKLYAIFYHEQPPNEIWPSFSSSKFNMISQGFKILQP